MWKCFECNTENEATTEICQKCETPRDPNTYVGEQIGQWRLERLLGEGGMAVVFLARHGLLGTKAAVKILRSELTGKRDVIERFRTEAMAASHLRHENVIQVSDFGFQKGIGFYMILEFLEGEDLEAKLQSTEFPLPLPWVVGIAKQMADGLTAAHEAGIIHRDLKPSNIFLVKRPEQELPLVKVLDFGIAKIKESDILEESQQNLTRTGTVLGTPFYLSPEQLTRRSGVELGPSVDIYAFGVILYQMMTGKLPIEESTIAEQMVGILTKLPPPAGEHRPELAGTALEIFLQRVLAKQPGGRPISIREAIEAFVQAALAFDDQAENLALRQRWEEVYRPALDADARASGVIRPAPAPLPPPPPSSTRLVIFAFLATFLFGGLVFLGYTFLSRPSLSEQEKSFLQLQNRAIAAYNAKKYDEALSDFQKLLNDPRWQKSQAYNPKIKLAAGISLRQTNKGTLQALQLLQDASRAKQLSEEERELARRQIDDTQNEINKATTTYRTILAGVKDALEKKEYEKGLSLLKLIFGVQVPSNLPFQYLKDPSDPNPYAEAGKLLRPFFPYLSLRMLQKALPLPSPSGQAHPTAGLYEQGSKAAEEEKKSRLQALSQALASGTDGKDALEALLSIQKDNPSLLLATKVLLEENLTKDPARLFPLLTSFQAHAKGLRESPAWLWYQISLGASMPSSKALETLSKTAELLAGVQPLVTKAAQALKDEKFKAAQGFFKRAANLLGTEEALGISPEIKKQHGHFSSLSENLVQSQRLWQEAARLYKKGDLASAEKAYLSFAEGIKHSGAEASFQAKVDQWLEKAEKLAQSRFEAADKSFQPSSLSSALQAARSARAVLEPLARSNSPHASKARLRLASVQQMINLLDPVSQLWKQIQNKASDRDLGGLRASFKELEGKLQSHPRFPAFRREFDHLVKRHYEGSTLLSKTDDEFSAKRWESAENGYHTFLKTFPKSRESSRVRINLQDAICNQNVPWKECKRKNR